MCSWLPPPPPPSWALILGGAPRVKGDLFGRGNQLPLHGLELLVQRAKGAQELVRDRVDTWGTCGDLWDWHVPKDGTSGGLSVSLSGCACSGAPASCEGAQGSPRGLAAGHHAKGGMWQISQRGSGTQRERKSPGRFRTTAPQGRFTAICRELRQLCTLQGCRICAHHPHTCLGKAGLEASPPGPSGQLCPHTVPSPGENRGADSCPRALGALSPLCKD